MLVKVRIPTPLQKLTDNQEEVEVQANNVQTVIDELEKKFRGFKDQLCDENGKIRRFINIYLNDEDVRFLQAEITPVKDGDQILLNIPFLSG